MMKMHENGKKERRKKGENRESCLREQRQILKHFTNSIKMIEK